MDMKDRVDNLLTVIRERVTDENANVYELLTLRQRLEQYLERAGLMDLKDQLCKEWDDIIFNHELAQWDEAFLKAVAGEPTTEAIKYSSHRYSHAHLQTTQEQQIARAFEEYKRQQLTATLNKTQMKLADKLGVSYADYAKMTANESK